MTTAHPKVRIQYLRDSQAVYTANGAEGLRYATSGSVGLDLRLCLAIFCAWAACQWLSPWESWREALGISGRAVG